MNKYKYMYIYSNNGKIKTYFTNNNDKSQVVPTIYKLEGAKVKMLEMKYIGD